MFQTSAQFRADGTQLGKLTTMTIYTDTARFDTGRAMTEDEIRAVAPSVFATTAHESRSERFAPIPTIEVLRGLANEGFGVVGARQAVTRVAGKAPYTKHLLRLRKMDVGNSVAYHVGDTVCEMLLKNANDGTCVYDLMAGLFRIRCLNSLVAQIGELEAVKVRHSGDVANKVIEGTYRVIGEAQKALAAPQDWGRINLNRDEQHVFAEAAHVLRFGEADEGGAPPAIRVDQLLGVRRTGDTASDLWTTFNVVQENAIRGGLHGVTRDANNRRRNMTTRPIKGIDQDIKLNRALWTLAERMAELKA